MPGPGEHETCRDTQVAKENPDSTDTPKGMREKGVTGERDCQLMQIFRVTMNMCDWTHSRKVQAKEERPDPPPYVQAAYNCTRSVHGDRWSGGKALQSPDLLKDTSPEHRAVWGWCDPLGQGLLKQRRITVRRDGSNLFFLDSLLFSATVLHGT